jgi:hypothetical protein
MKKKIAAIIKRSLLLLRRCIFGQNIRYLVIFVRISNLTLNLFLTLSPREKLTLNPRNGDI